MPWSTATPALGFSARKSTEKTLGVIAQFNELWAPMQINALSIAQGDGTAEDVLTLNVQSAELLQVAHMLVSKVAAQYFNPTETRLADAMLVDIAERQQFLAQEISKNACLVSSSIATESMTDALWSARMAFNSSMGASSSGMPSLGIQAPPTSRRSTQALLQCGLLGSTCDSRSTHNCLVIRSINRSWRLSFTAPMI